MKRLGSIALILLALVLTAPVLRAQADDLQRIVVPLSEPDRPASLSCGLMYGSIAIKGGSGKEVVVTVRPEPADDEGERTHDGLRRIPNTAIGLEIEEQRNHVEVGGGYMNRSITLEITVPTKTSLSLSLVNGGEIEIENVEGEHEISNVNGGITAKGVRGSVVANSTNGDIRVAFTGITPDKAMAFTTFNGDVDVTLPASTKANLKLNPGRGEILTDFDVDLQQTGAKVERGQGPAGYRVTLERDMQGKIGGGGPEMEFRTYNGDIYLRRAK